MFVTTHPWMMHIIFSFANVLMSNMRKTVGNLPRLQQLLLVIFQSDSLPIHFRLKGHKKTTFRERWSDLLSLSGQNFIWLISHTLSK